MRKVRLREKPAMRVASSKQSKLIVHAVGSGNRRQKPMPSFRKVITLIRVLTSTAPLFKAVLSDHAETCKGRKSIYILTLLREVFDLRLVISDKTGLRWAGMSTHAVLDVPPRCTADARGEVSSPSQHALRRMMANNGLPDRRAVFQGLKFATRCRQILLVAIWLCLVKYWSRICVGDSFHFQ